MNHTKQHTHRWHSIKQFNLGANDIASLLGVGFSDAMEIINHKIHGTQDEHDQVTQQLLDRGNRYESLVRDQFEQRHGVKVIETGLKRHSTHHFITASPDGYLSQFGDHKGGCLLELKVRRELSKKIPMKYWVQMQVQMEVWDIPHCVYCENVVVESPIETENTFFLEWNGQTYHWQLKEFREQVVARDVNWWQSVFPKISAYWSRVEAGRGQVQTRSTRSRKRTAEESGLDVSEDELHKRRMFSNVNIIQPYMLGNYFRSDPLLDWLNLYGPPDRRDTEVNFFLTMIRNKNRDFNALVTDYITKKFPTSTYNVCKESFQIGTDQAQYVELHKLGFTFEGVERTKVAMEQKVPIIFNPCFNVTLPSYSYPFGGRADMIVLNRHLGDLLGLFEMSDDPEDAYTVVNFKYATINLKADKTHLLNNPKQKVYKAHMWLLNAALGVQQGSVPKRGYFIGRKYDFNKRGITYRIMNAFQGIGTVDFEDVDENYETDCRKALEWLELVQTPEAQHWNPFAPDIEQMYPNMKNAMDFPWHDYKRDIAVAIKDITLMHHCGPKVRKFAHEHGVTEWQDLTTDTIIYNSGKLLNRIMQFVDVNKPNSQQSPDLTLTDQANKSIGRKGYIRGRPCIEFYLDFESIGNMYDDFSQFPQASNQAMIFLIGLIVVDNVTGKRNYISYLIDRLDHGAERDMIQKMLTDMKNTREAYDQNFAPVYFWSNAENYMLKRAMGPDVVQENGLLMVDLCKAFRESGLILPGQMGYGLKEVAKTMYKYGMIKTTWNETLDVASGLNATIEAMKTYNHRDKETRQQYFSSLIDYNYVDCKVMEEILEYLRDTVAAQERVVRSPSPSPSLSMCSSPRSEVPFRIS